MELQLGLSLQTTQTLEKLKGFDLNTTNVEFEGDNFQLDIPMITINNNDNGENWFNLDLRKKKKKKRSFVEAFDHCGSSSTKITLLPLLSLNVGDDDDDDDDDLHHQHANGKKKIHNNAIHNGRDEGGEKEDDVIIGGRKKIIGGFDDDDDDDRTAEEIRRKRRKSKYVKVNMEGVGIGRKIDLRLFDSYHTLLSTLITMFSTYKKTEKDNVEANYALSFQDNQGHWLLAQDVPWQTFIQTVKRIELHRNVAN